METIFTRMKTRNDRRGERGATLAFTLMILMILVLIGLAALMTSSLDLKISGNERVQKQAFYRAEAGINFAQMQVIYSQLNAGTRTQELTYAPTGTTEAAVTVQFPSTIPGGIQNPTALPPGQLSSMQYYSAYHYVITSNGQAAGQAQALLELRGFTEGFIPVAE